MPFLLVGTQVDLRDDGATLETLAKNKQQPVTFESGEKLAHELKAVKYMECSALTQVQRGEVCCCDLLRVSVSLQHKNKRNVKDSIPEITGSLYNSLN